MVTLQDILLDSAAFLDLEATLPIDVEYEARVRYANMAVREAANLSVLPEFNSEYVVNMGTLASISLPTDFRELTESPAILLQDGTWDSYEAINPRIKRSKLSSDKYSYLLGYPGAYTLVLNNPSPNATLSIQYQRYPTAMVSLTSVCELSDQDYVSTKLNALVLKARGDDRFPVIDAEANTKLKNMVSRSQKQNAGTSGSTPKSFNYSIGE